MPASLTPPHRGPYSGRLQTLLTRWVNSLLSPPLSRQNSSNLPPPLHPSPPPHTRPPRPNALSPHKLSLALSDGETLPKILSMVAPGLPVALQASTPSSASPDSTLLSMLGSIANLSARRSPHPGAPYVPLNESGGVRVPENNLEWLGVVWELWLTHVHAHPSFQSALQLARTWLQGLVGESAVSIVPRGVPPIAGDGKYFPTNDSRSLAQLAVLLAPSDDRANALVSALKTSPWPPEPPAALHNTSIALDTLKATMIANGASWPVWLDARDFLLQGPFAPLIDYAIVSMHRTLAALAPPSAERFALRDSIPPFNTTATGPGSWPGSSLTPQPSNNSLPLNSSIAQAADLAAATAVALAPNAAQLGPPPFELAISPSLLFEAEESSIGSVARDHSESESEGQEDETTFLYSSLAPVTPPRPPASSSTSSPGFFTPATSMKRRPMETALVSPSSQQTLDAQIAAVTSPSKLNDEVADDIVAQMMRLTSLPGDEPAPPFPKPLSDSHASSTTAPRQPVNHTSPRSLATPTPESTRRPSSITANPSSNKPDSPHDRQHDQERHQLQAKSSPSIRNERLEALAAPKKRLSPLAARNRPRFKPASTRLSSKTVDASDSGYSARFEQTKKSKAELLETRKRLAAAQRARMAAHRDRLAAARVPKPDPPPHPPSPRMPYGPLPKPHRSATDSKKKPLKSSVAYQPPKPSRARSKSTEPRTKAPAPVVQSPAPAPAPAPALASKSSPSVPSRSVRLLRTYTIPASSSSDLSSSQVRDDELDSDAENQQEGDYPSSMAAAQEPIAQELTSSSSKTARKTRSKPASQRVLEFPALRAFMGDPEQLSDSQPSVAAVNSKSLAAARALADTYARVRALATDAKAAASSILSGSNSAESFIPTSLLKRPQWADSTQSWAWIVDPWGMAQGFGWADPRVGTEALPLTGPQWALHGEQLVIPHHLSVLDVSTSRRSQLAAQTQAGASNPTHTLSRLHLEPAPGAATVGILRAVSRSDLDSLSNALPETRWMAITVLTWASPSIHRPQRVLDLPVAIPLFTRASIGAASVARSVVNRGSVSRPLSVWECPCMAHITAGQHSPGADVILSHDERSLVQSLRVSAYTHGPEFGLAADRGTVLAQDAHAGLARHSLDDLVSRRVLGKDPWRTRHSLTPAAPGPWMP